MNTQLRKVLVTGGAGYIGSVLCRLLLRHGFLVRVIDNFSFGGESLLGLLPEPDFHLLHADIRKKRDVNEALDGVDAVVHLAAIVGDPACSRRPGLAKAVNGEASDSLLAAARKKGVRRFLFASTCSNYGRMDSDSGPLDETAPLKPVSLYAELKVAFEQRLAESTTDVFTPVILRFATAFGLSPRPRFDLTVNEFTRDLYLGRKLEVYGEQFWRPYCHTTDLSRACLLALTAPAEHVAGKAFNVGDTDENYRKQDLVEMILRQLPERENLVSYVRKQEDPRDYRVDAGRIHEELGFSVTRRVGDGILEIVEALRSGLITDPESPRYRNL